MSAASLKVTSTTRPGSRLAVEVAIPAERSQASYEAAISQLSRSVNLPGFRKGKVPRSVLVQQLGGLRIRATALENLVVGLVNGVPKREKVYPRGSTVIPMGFLLVRWFYECFFQNH